MPRGASWTEGNFYDMAARARGLKEKGWRELKGKNLSKGENISKKHSKKK